MANLFGEATPGDDVGVLASVPTMKSPLEPWLCRVLQSARQSIWMTMAYFVPDDVAHSAVIHPGYVGIDVFADADRYRPREED